jgi:general transcription factor 3C polypeptide 3 (transcription factor C subunit 4)
MNNHQFNNELVRVFFASLAGSMRAADAFIDTALQKHIFRELRIVESALAQPDALRWAPSKKKWGIVKGKGAPREDAPDEDEEDVEQPEAKPSKVPLCAFPTKENPVLMTLYGQMTATAKSYQSAICTFCAHTFSAALLTCPSSLLASRVRLVSARSHHMSVFGSRIDRTGDAATSR